MHLNWIYLESICVGLPWKWHLNEQPRQTDTDLVFLWLHYTVQNFAQYFCLAPNKRGFSMERIPNANNGA